MGSRSRTADHLLVIVQNMSVPQDRRVWQECQELVRAGYHVSVICPTGPREPTRDEIDGVRLYRYRPAPPTSGFASYAYEFAYSWLRTAWLSAVAYRHRRFDVIQACNPPDTYWLLALLWRLVGVSFVYDQHDLNPELFESRFGEPSTRLERLLHRGLIWLEHMTYRVADHVIATNESYRRIAIQRGGQHPDNVTVVRSGPDTTRMRPVRPSRDVSRSGEYLVVYLGVMGPQDNVDVVLEVMAELVHKRGRTDVRAALLGYGDSLPTLKEHATLLGLDDYVEFTGRADKAMIADYLSSADVGLCPDLKTPLNDVSTMNKTMEYMAYCLPSVSFDLHETRVSAGDTAVFVEPGDIAGFADAIEELLDDPDYRVEIGLAARRRVQQHLDWATQAPLYVGVYDRVTGRGSPSVRRLPHRHSPANPATAGPWGEDDLATIIHLRWRESRAAQAAARRAQADSA